MSSFVEMVYCIGRSLVDGKIQVSRGKWTEAAHNHSELSAAHTFSRMVQACGRILPFQSFSALPPEIREIHPLSSAHWICTVLLLAAALQKVNETRSMLKA